MTLQIHPMADPTKRCSKSRRTSWNNKLRRSTKFRKNNVPGSLLATMKLHNTSFINNLQWQNQVDTSPEPCYSLRFANLLLPVFAK